MYVTTYRRLTAYRTPHSRFSARLYQLYQLPSRDRGIQYAEIKRKGKCGLEWNQEKKKNGRKGPKKKIEKVKKKQSRKNKKETSVRMD